MRFFLFLFLGFVLNISVHAQAPLFFSEYIEGSGNNKYLELFNPSASESLDLSEYRVELFSNGSSEASNNSVTLSGTLSPRSVFVIANSSGTLYGGADITSNVTFYNGDDALAIKHLPTGAYTDIIGTIGEDPGSAWISGNHSTQEKTLIRKSFVSKGVTVNPSSGFPTLETEWDVFPQDSADDLGKHTFGEVIEGTSDVVRAQTWQNGSSFDYLPFVGSASEHSQWAGRWIFRDGGDSEDQDDLPSIVNTITLSIPAYEMIGSLVIQHGTSELARIEVTNSELQLDLNSFTIPDNGRDSIDIFLTYSPPVLENTTIQVTLSNILVSEEGSSGFIDEPSQGYITTSPGSPEVTATQLAYVSIPETVLFESPFDITIASIDEFESVDLDNSSSATLVLREGEGSISVSGGATQTFQSGLITFSVTASITSESFFLSVESSEYSDIITPAIFIQEIDEERIGQGLTGSELISFLDANFGIPNDKGLGYDRARDFMYSQIDNRQGFVRGVYTGVTIETNSRGDAFEKGINTEHTWPQGLFGSDEPMKGDIHHLFPTVIEVNSARGSLPFDEIPDNLTDQWFVSKTPQTSIPNASVIDDYSELDSGRSFEPREDHKGNVARAIFYFWTIYQDKSDVSDDAGFFNAMKDVLYEWHQLDPADQIEIDRSLAVEQVQGNKNPFVHDPTLVQRAYFPNDVPTEVTVSLVSPQNRASEVGLFPTLEWSSANGSTNYQLLLSVDSTFTTAQLDTLVTTTSLSLPFSLEANQTYFWKAKPNVAGAVNQFSSTFRFTTTTTSFPSVQLLFPESGAVDTELEVEFIWSSLDEASSYRFQFGESSDLSTLLRDTLIVGDTTISVPDLKGTTTYYWKVRAESNEILGEWSDTFDFTTKLDVFNELDLNRNPKEWILKQNYPNPFNPTTSIRFALPERADITLEVFSMLGQKVATLASGTLSAGWHTVQFNASNLSSGIYMYRLHSKQTSFVRQMILIK